MNGPERAVVIEMPSALVEHLADLQFGADVRNAYHGGKVVRRGRGYTLRITAPIEVHHWLLERCWALGGAGGVESTAAERRAHRTYAQRIAEQEGGLRRG